jgi:RNA polymerase sigma-70 factor (ECF subfamily)
MAPSPEHLDDSSFPSVLIGAKKGEAWAAEALFTDLQPRLLRFLRSTEPRAADDLAGEVWLAMAKGIRDFEGDLLGFRAWVFAIARRRLADHRRTAARRATDVVDPYDDVMRGADHDAGADVADLVTSQLSAQEAVDLIHATLPPDQAEVLLLRILGDLDVPHVAEVMQRSSNWVRVNQFRALRRLAEHFPPDSVGAVMHADHETI